MKILSPGVTCLLIIDLLIIGGVGIDDRTPILTKIVLNGGDTILIEIAVHGCSELVIIDSCRGQMSRQKTGICKHDQHECDNKYDGTDNRDHFLPDGRTAGMRWRLGQVSG